MTVHVESHPTRLRLILRGVFHLTSLSTAVLDIRGGRTVQRKIHATTECLTAAVRRAITV